MKIIKKTFEELKNDATFSSYVVKCDSEKYATHKTIDGVFVCFYGSVVLDNIME